MLELVDLSRRYGDVVALDGLSVSIPSGEVFGLLGPNGAGKTTAMRVVLGITLPDGGSIAWRGRPVRWQDRHRFGYLPEERGLYAGMKVAEHLEYLGRLHGLPRGAARAAVAEWLERLGLVGRADDKVSALSLGNQQRVQLAAALVHAPEVLVLDEPFSGLDPIGMDTLGTVLDEIASSGAVVVFSSHQLDLVESRCRSVAIIHRGRAVASGSVAELTSGGRKRLVVDVDGGKNWTEGLRGVTVSERSGDVVRLVLDDGADPQAVLSAAQASGAVRHFSFERRRLSEVFREAVAI
jgi:ABC-2 type transport system ATP-binding protein